ncbi:putative fungal zn(2)-cys(6) binuclear cluster domain protein [Rhizoctonia solani 123E]|uniref:Putative fungal zn(2)-cys(6) binuclear cluster domain protein n=1 Tax=Rhizoctonia solani 123E TaxID=1423351 RepID=A0A074RGH3_9AGAM|nr:putative fungal zn(2)-cys(6) binuclear cluster domain protein [Rhizoctonia solani 123E]
MYSTGASCLTCQVRNRTCDRSRPTCKRCAQTGGACEGYPQESRSLRHNQALSRVKSSSNLPVIFSSAASDQDPLFDPSTNTHGQISYQPPESVPLASYATHTDTSLFVSSPNPLSLGLSPASSSHTTYYSPQISHSPGQSLSPSEVASYSSPQQSLTPDFTTCAFFNNPQGIPSQHWPTLDEDSDSDDPEDVKEALSDVVAFAGNPESESVVNCYSLWTIRFLFEPLRGIPTVRDIIIQGFARGGESLWRMMLLSNIAWQVLGTNPSDIDNPPYFSTLYSHILQRLAAARCHFESSRELDRCYALDAIEQTFELVCIMCKIGTLSDIINVMQHAAPVFRRACPDSPESLVNLPSLLTTIDISLQSYATHDILLSMLTHRPMFFRYDVNYPPHLSDISFSTDDGPGLRWLYGVPDWLMVILARMNTLLEDYGSCLDPTVATGLEEEIRSKRTIVAAGVDPSLSMGRIVVQESWRLAALIYLFMALCGADSKDTRVTKVHSKFMKLYTGVEPRRIPDSFLVLPMLILGLPAPVKERKLIRERMLDLMECSRPNTFGNEVVRILDDTWARADERGRAGSAGASSSTRGASGGPEGSSGWSGSAGDNKAAGAVVWSDLRMGCLRVTGM